MTMMEKNQAMKINNYNVVQYFTELFERNAVIYRHVNMMYKQRYSTFQKN